MRGECFICSDATSSSTLPPTAQLTSVNIQRCIKTAEAYIPRNDVSPDCQHRAFPPEHRAFSLDNRVSSAASLSLQMFTNTFQNTGQLDGCSNGGISSAMTRLKPKTPVNKWRTQRGVWLSLSLSSELMACIFTPSGTHPSKSGIKNVA